MLDEIHEDLKLTERNNEASRRTLERFGVSSSRSIWYELAYLEHKAKMRRGDMVWQIRMFKATTVLCGNTPIAHGVSGFVYCSSIVKRWPQEKKLASV